MNELSNEQLVDHVYSVWGKKYDGDTSAKFIAEDVDEELLSIARMWLMEYEGDFEFLISVKTSIEQENKPFTTGAAKGVLNCMVADAKRARGITGGGGGRKLTRIPALGQYAVTVGEYVDIYQIKTWTPKGSDKQLLMVQAHNFPDAQWEWEMVAVIDPDQQTYNIMKKVTDEVMRESLTLLIEADPDTARQYARDFHNIHIGKDLPAKSIF